MDGMGKLSGFFLDFYAFIAAQSAKNGFLSFSRNTEGVLFSVFIGWYFY